MNRTFGTLAIAVVSVITAGCGGPLDIVSVSGDVAYDDGSAIPSDGFRLRFVPLMESPDGKHHPRPADAIIGSDGKFESVTTHKYNDGLIRGKHRVYFSIGDGPDGEPLVPASYVSPDDTPLEVDISKTRKLEIRVPKP